jgi:hypothetical protein
LITWANNNKLNQKFSIEELYAPCHNNTEDGALDDERRGGGGGGDDLGSQLKHNSLIILKSHMKYGLNVGAFTFGSDGGGGTSGGGDVRAVRLPVQAGMNVVMGGPPNSPVTQEQQDEVDDSEYEVINHETDVMNSEMYQDLPISQAVYSSSSPSPRAVSSTTGASASAFGEGPLEMSMVMHASEVDPEVYANAPLAHSQLTPTVEIYQIPSSSSSIISSLQAATTTTTTTNTPPTTSPSSLYPPLPLPPQRSLSSSSSSSQRNAASNISAIETCRFHYVWRVELVET